MTDAQNSRKKYHKPIHVIGAALAIAAGLLLLTILILYIIGFRYLTSQSESGKIKFFGRVDSSGTPVSGTLYYPDGLKAEVNSKDSTLKYSDGSLYEGSLTKLKKTGNGKMSFPNGDVYIGSFDNDMINGSGEYTYSNGDTYEGEFKNGRKHGQGKYTFASDGSYYEGSFAEDAKSGQGKFVQADGSVYEGSYENDVKNGMGRFTFSNGDTYEGNFVNDLRTGNGKYVWAENGDTYEGEFLNNMMHGWGKYTWSAGRFYEGVFENGVIVRIETPEGSGDNTTQTPNE